MTSAPIGSDTQFFRDNLQALEFGYPTLAQNVKTFLHHNLAMPQFCTDLFDLYAEDTVSFPEQAQLQQSDLLILCGIGLYNDFSLIRSRMPGSVTALVIEPDMERFITALYCVDIAAMLEGWHVKFLINVPAEEIAAHMSQYHFELHNPVIMHHKKWYAEKKSYFDTAIQTICSLPLAISEPSPETQRTSKRFLMMVGRKGVGWPFIMQDTITALHELGHSVKLLHLEVGNTCYQFRQAMNAFKPDFIIMLDAIGLMPEEFNRHGIPYISWYFDNPFNWLKEEHASPNYIVFVWDKTYVQQLKDTGFTHVYYMPLAANTTVFYPREPQSRYACEISFVGSSLHSSEEPPFDSQAKREFIKIISTWLIQAPWVSVWDIIENINKQLGISFKLDDPERKREFELFIQNFARSMYRNRIIQAMVPFEPHLYGDEGWLKIASPNLYKGRIDNRTGLPVVYSSSQININITVPQLRNSFSHRAFEIPACGGFLLSDYRPEAENFFELGREIVCFKTIEDLTSKLTYYRSHPNECKKIAERGYKRVLRDHTYTARAKSIIDTLKSL
ncbi:MAG: glycosyltransferase [Candidatus Auribacterota bacterium]